jgi:hypothetical protein
MLRHFLYAGRVDTFRRCSAASWAPPRALAFSPSCEKICGDQSYSALNIAFGTHFKNSGCEAAPYSPPSTHANQEQSNHRVLVLALPRAAARGSTPRQVVHPRTVARNPGGAGLRPFTLFIMCIGTHFAGEREPLVTTAAQWAEISALRMSRISGNSEAAILDEFGREQPLRVHPGSDQAVLWRDLEGYHTLSVREPERRG